MTWQVYYGWSSSDGHVLYNFDVAIKEGYYWDEDR